MTIIAKDCAYDVRCIPTLPTQPWEQCVSEILGSQSLRYDMVQEEVETDLFESLEEANSLIKSWATGHPPCQTTVEDASQGQAYICYGTVSQMTLSQEPCLHEYPVADLHTLAT